MNSIMRALVVALALCGASAVADDAVTTQDNQDRAEHATQNHTVEATRPATPALASEEEKKAAVTVDDVLAELANRLAENNAQLGS